MRRTSGHIWAWVGLFVAFAVLVVAAALNLGAAERRLSLTGPFKAETEQSGTRALIVELRPMLPLRRGFTSGGDSNFNPQESTLQVQINGTPLDRPHSLHDLIRHEGGGAFSHWGEHLIFSLPTGVPNDASTRLDIHFNLYLHPRASDLALLLGVACAFVLLRRFHRENPVAYGERMARFLTSWGWVLQGVLVFCLLAALGYLGTVVAGVWSGFALPNTALFRWWPQWNGLALHEPAFGHVILALGLAGVAGAWVAVSSPASARAYARLEDRLAASFNRYGVLFVLALFLYSVGATWAGIPRPEDFSGSAIAGLLPFSDAHGHYEQIYFQAMGGSWEPFIARRPLAASFRGVLVAVVEFNNFHYLMLQTSALAIATFFASRAVVAWRGVWAGLTFLGLVFIVVRPYLPTNLTEPLGLFWALTAIPFLIRALRFERLRDAALTIHLSLWALLTRMGAMFTLPAMGLWVIFSRSGSRRDVLRAMLSVGGLVFINVVLISGMSKLYGTAGGAVGSNFSHTICGLAHGRDWSGCGEIYAGQLAAMHTEAEQANFFYAMAQAKFLEQPGLLLDRLWQGEMYFLSRIWKQMLSGYSGAIPKAFPSIVWSLVALAGLVGVMRRQSAKHEGKFWLLFLTGLAASAPFVIFDDGWRVLCASFVVLALLLSCGYASPLHQPTAQLPRRQRVSDLFHYTLLALVMALCLTVPAFVHEQDWLGRHQMPHLKLEPDEDLILGTRRMAGFLVVPDGQVLPTAVPAIHHSAFVQIVRSSGIERYDALVTPAPIHRPPFAIAAAIPVHRRTNGLLILPPEVFTSLDDRLWRIRFESTRYWSTVTDATPVSP